MNTRLLVALPVVFAAAITAAACSSSSTTTTSTGAACATLAECCSGALVPSITGTPASETSCDKAVATGNESTCTSALSTFTGGGFCTTTPTTSGSGSSGSSGSGSGTGTGPGSSSGSGSSGDAGTTATCANPGAIPVGFTPPTGIVGSGCTSAQVQALGQCDVATTDAGQHACTSDLVNDAETEQTSCGACVETLIVPTGFGANPSLWGANLIPGFQPTLTNTSENNLNFIGSIGPNFGGCVYAADPSTAGKTCGLDLMALQACEFAVCLSVCAVPNTTSDSELQTAVDAFFTCNTKADSTSCQTYLTKAKTDCATEINDAGTGVYDQCAKLYNTDIGDTEAGVETAATETQLLGLLCGGADAGF